MARPQTEDGFTRVANEILDNICRFNFNGSQLRIVMKIWRMTYGFSRKDHNFSVSFLHGETGLSEVTIKKELAYLIKTKVLFVTKAATNVQARRFSFNKNYEEWEVPSMAKKDDLEVKDSLPLDESLRYTIVTPETDLEVYDTLPQNVTLGYTILTPNKEIDLKEKKIFKENVSFDDFYDVYPRKMNKQAALKAWGKLAKEKNFDPALIINHTRNFAETCQLLGTEKIYIAHPSTFLNQKRYEDYDTVDPEGLAKPTLTEKGKRNAAQMDMLMGFYQEGEDNEQAGNGSIIGGNQNSLPGIRNN